MKGLILGTLVLVTPLFLILPAKAENPADVERLLTTGECMNCDLREANLSGEHLIGVDLRNANLAGANLEGANLEGADLTGANLQEANLTGVFLTNATLNYANLNGVNMSYVVAYDTDVSGASMERVNLANAEIFNTGIAIGGEYPELEDSQEVIEIK